MQPLFLHQLHFLGSKQPSPSIKAEQSEQNADSDKPEVSPLEKDIRAALGLRPEVIKINAQIDSTFTKLCQLESGQAPAALNRGDFKTNQTRPNLEFGLCSPFPLYTSEIEAAIADDLRGLLVAVLSQREKLYETIRSQVTKARENLDLLTKEEQKKYAEIDEAESAVVDSLERQRLGASLPFETVEAQVRLAQAKSKFDQAHRRVVSAQKTLDCATGRIPCSPQP